MQFLHLILYQNNGLFIPLLTSLTFSAVLARLTWNWISTGIDSGWCHYSESCLELVILFSDISYESSSRRSNLNFYFDERFYLENSSRRKSVLNVIVGENNNFHLNLSQVFLSKIKNHKKGSIETSLQEFTKL